jgi:hypothetical protein
LPPAIDGEGPRSDPAAQGVVDRVADDRGDGEQDENQAHMQVVRKAGRHGPSGEEERIPRQKRHDHQPGFAEDDREQQGVGPRPPGLEHAVQHLIELEEQVEDRVGRIHSST